MKAVYFDSTGSIENLRWGECSSANLFRESLRAVAKTARDDSSLLSGEVRVRALCGALNQLDMWVLKGLPHLKMNFPHIAGADLCAEVIDSKSSVFKKGDPILVYPGFCSELGKGHENLQKDFGVRGEDAAGIFQEEAVFSEKEIKLAPKHLSDEEAASFPLVGLTAWQMIVGKAGLFPGNFSPEEVGPILVHGAGSGVTHALLEFLISMGLQKNLVVSSRSEEKLKKWKDRGLHTQIFHGEMAQDLKKLLGGERFSIIFDHVGSASFETNIRCLRNGGKLVTCGATSGFSVEMDLRHIFFRQLQILGSTMGSLRHFQDMLDWVSSHELRLQVSEVHPVQQVQKAYQSLLEHSQDGKIVLDFRQSS